MISHIVTIEDQAKVYKGIEEAAKVVCSTMGPFKSTVMIKSGGKTFPSQDGYRILKYQLPQDPFEQIGYRLMLDAVSHAVENAGDGTTTCTKLVDAAHSAYLLAAKAAEKVEGQNPRDRKAGINGAVAKILSVLYDIARPIVKDGEVDLEILKNVAIVSASGDKEMGLMIAELIHKVGIDGVITVEPSTTGKTYSEITPGYSFRSGVISTQFYTSEKGLSLKKPFIALVNQPLTEMTQLKPLIEHYQEHSEKVSTRNGMMPSTPLVIICPQVDMSLSSQIIRNRVETGLPVFLIQAPGPNFFDNMKDIQVITNTYGIYDRKEGYKLKDFGMNGVMEFGTVDRLDSTTTHTTLYFNADGDVTPGITEQVKLLKSLMESDTANVEDYKKRIARLANGVGVIYVGGASNAEHENLLDPIEDAQLACFCAIDRGVLPGGGKALVYAAKKIGEAPNDASFSFKLGWELVRSACKEPFLHILKNAGISDKQRQKHLSEVSAVIDPWHGIDIVTMKKDDMLTLGIIDPLKVTEYALVSAMSVVSNLVTTKYFQIQNEETNHYAGLPQNSGSRGGR